MCVYVCVRAGRADQAVSVRPRSETGGGGGVCERVRERDVALRADTLVAPRTYPENTLSFH